MGCTLLMRAAEWGWLVVLQSLLQDGKVDVNDSDLFGETALLKAAKQGRRAVVDALIRYGADISAKCADQHSLLTWAIRNHWGASRPHLRLRLRPRLHSPAPAACAP